MSYCGFGDYGKIPDMRMLTQVDLRSDNRLLTCWVEPKVVVGNRITLKDTDEPERLWEVLRVGVKQKATDVKRGWDNNY